MAVHFNENKHDFDDLELVAIEVDLVDGDIVNRREGKRIRLGNSLDLQ